MTIKRAPTGLKASGKRFWRKVMAEFVLKDTHDLERLKLACSCLDEIAAAESIVADEGLFIKDRFEQTREHPGIKTIHDNKVLFLRAVRELGLDLNVPEDSRPPRQY